MESEPDDEPTNKGTIGLDAEDDPEERRRERQRIATRRKLQAINREGGKLKRQLEKGSLGEEETTSKFDLLGLYR